MANIVFKPIGIIHSPFQEPQGTPIQPGAGREAAGTVEIFREFAAGLADLEGFSHIILIYYFHLCQGFSLRVKPFLDECQRGVFATRAPARPNPIGLSIVALDRVEGSILHVREVDIVDGTPLLDLKPYVPLFDQRAPARIGWLAGKLERLEGTRDDGRFLK
jgi:tRNA-Thr(GGU) m(6)t(6)A37 methyltransferase TsaA